MNQTNGLKTDEISIYHIVLDLVKNIWVILLVAAAVWLGLGSVIKMMYVPEYTASATVAVGTKGKNTNSLNSLNTTKQLAGAFGEVFQSNVLMDKVREDLGDADAIGKISAQAVSETNLMILQAVSGDPRTAYLMLQSAFRNYESVSEYLFSNASLRIVKEPSVPFAPSNSAVLTQDRKLAALAAAVLTAGVIVLLSVLRFTVKTKNGAVRNLDGNVLGLVPFERGGRTLRELAGRKEKHLLVSSSTVSMPFTEAYRKLSARLEHHMKKRGQKVLLVTSVSANEGKSSTAANLALTLAEKGRKVLLVDLDLKKPSQYKAFKGSVEIKHFLEDYLEGRAEAEDILAYDSKDGLYLILQEKGIEQSTTWANSDRLRELLQKYRGEMDYIILDTSPMAVAADAEYLMAAADTAAIVVRQDWTDVQSINEAVDNVRQSRTDLAGFVLNAFVKQGTVSGRYGKYGYYRYGKRRESDAR